MRNRTETCNRNTSLAQRCLCSYMRHIGRKLWDGVPMDRLVTVRTHQGTGGWELTFNDLDPRITYVVRPHGLCLECETRVMTEGEYVSGGTVHEIMYEITDGILQNTVHALHRILLPPEPGYIRTIYGTLIRLMYPMCLSGKDGNESVGRLAEILGELDEHGWNRDESMYLGKPEPVMSPVVLDGTVKLRELVHRGEDGIDVSLSVLDVRCGAGRELHVRMEHGGCLVECSCMSGTREYREFMEIFERLYSSADADGFTDALIDSIADGVNGKNGGRCTVSVSMQPGMLQWIRKTVRAGKYDSVSGYLCGLVRERMESEEGNPCRESHEKYGHESVRKFRDMFSLAKKSGELPGIRIHSWYVDVGRFGCSVDTFCDAGGNRIDNTGKHGGTCPLRLVFEFPLDGDIWRMHWEWRVDGDDGFLSVIRTKDHEYMYDPNDTCLKELSDLVFGGRSWIPRKKVRK